MNIETTNVKNTNSSLSGLMPCYRQFFIRFKNIPENEISGVYDGDCGKIRDENYNIILSSISTGFLHDLCWFLNDFKDGKIPAYLIEAEQIGIGSYGEPVFDILSRLERLEKAAGIRIQCLGCGAKFISDKPSKDVAVCPNCPLSNKELEDFKKQMFENSK